MALAPVQDYELSKDPTALSWPIGDGVLMRPFVKELVRYVYTES